MLKTLYQSILSTLVLAAICCGVYPILVTALGQILFQEKANGSLIRGAGGTVLGSALIGQSFSKPEYFRGRPSAAGSGYDAAASSGSNLGPTNQKFADTLQANVEAFLKDNPSVRKSQIPNELVSASASGLDPHVSEAGALAQVMRVAQVRGVSAEQVRTLVEGHIDGPQLGILGEPRVNVLLLNLDLDQKYPMKK